MLMGSNLQEDIMIFNMYVPNNRFSNYRRQKLIEAQVEIGESIIIVGYFNTPLSEMDQSSRYKISKDIVELIASLINWLPMTSIDYFIQHQWNTHSPQVHTEYSPR